MTPGVSARRHDAELAKLFAPGGALASALPGYVRRDAQVEMAAEVAHAIDTRNVVIAEAGTGTGKTYAYLVPALLWGGKVIVSTGTKTLQDQLFERDLPAVRSALNVPVTIALLKGRSNYVCHYHAERTFENGRMTSREDVAHLRRIKTFLKTTRSGDKSELGTVPETALVWSLVTSTRDTCLGSECPSYKDCFVMKARRDAQQADIVVVNHHLFFADVMLRDEGVNELLPAANTVIFDEAHQLPDTATAFFGDVVGSSHINELCRDALAEGHTHARDAARWQDVVAPVEQAVRELRLAVAGAASGSTSSANPMRGNAAVKMALNQIAPSSDFFPALEKLRTELAGLANVLESQAARAETLDALTKRAKDLLGKLKAWDAPVAPPPVAGPDEEEAGHIAWVDVFASSIQLLRSPLSIAPIFTRERESYQRAWIFTSATLAIKTDFTHFSAQLGLQEATARTWPSPFDYERQAMLYVPKGMPEPHSSTYTQAVVDAVWPLVKVAGGRTFLLCTTLRAVDRAAEMLAERCESNGITLLKQGDAGRTELLDRFRNTANAILVGSQSFWEGIDVRGQALSLVVIDKLPFAPPDDPVLAARLARIEAAGRNPFMEYQVPSAVLSLKQGAGRLIRSETDRGVLMICDPRIISKPYGKRIWQSLPPFKRTRVADEALEFLRSVTASA